MKYKSKTRGSKAKRLPQRRGRPQREKGPRRGSLKEAWAQTKQELEKLAAQSPQASKSSDDAKQLALDPWQEEAFLALQEGANVVIDAPTTAGKTRVVEAFLTANIERPEFRACYTCPVKSLSNDKRREFTAIFGSENVGIATGDSKENLEAPLVVATLETYRNSLLGTEPDLDRQLVIFDEYHFIQDDSRGSAWEESMILTPPSCQILLMSASVDNPDEFTSWLDKLSKRQARLIKVSHRPVPLRDVVWYHDHWYLPEALPAKLIKAKGSDYLSNLRSEQICERLARIEDWQLTPAIVYAGKRAQCVELAHQLKHHIRSMNEDQHFAIQQALAELSAEQELLQYTDGPLRDLIEIYGIAYHHSGLIPPVRVMIEQMLKHGLLRFCFATMGLSLGINFSVKATVISDCRRPSEKGMTPYVASEILQMRGRAGRRGRDTVGFSLWPAISYYQRFGRTKREAGASNLRQDPTTFLGLVSRGYSLGAIERVYEQSFFKYKKPKATMRLLTREGLVKKLRSDVPCNSPAHEYALFRHKDSSLCSQCPLRRKCHRHQQQTKFEDLAQMHFHLHKVGALDDQEQLTPYGEIARHFPQNGGLLIARLVLTGAIHPGNMLRSIQLLGSLCLARFKRPSIDSKYAFPYSPNLLTEHLLELYPRTLFPEVYDAPFGSRQHYLFREFNPAGGYLISEWSRGVAWHELCSLVLSDAYREGDLSGLVYRVASYLQSFLGLKESYPKLSEAAIGLRSELLRPPVELS